MKEDQFLTVKEIADRLKVTPRTVRQWLSDGGLIGYALGGRKTGWRVSEADLEAFLSARRGTKPMSEKGEAR